MSTVLYPALFDIDDMFGPLEGYTYGARHNGWALPYFTRESADAILAGMCGSTEGPPALWYDDDLDAYVFDDGDSVTDYPGEVHVVGGIPTRIYPIGHPTRVQPGWLWEEVAAGSNLHA